jgi:antirestriction protein ArdC
MTTTDTKALTEQLHGDLAEQVEQLVTSEAWVRWLGTAARFHRYSFNNTMLILMQRPDATRVAGYRVWQEMGRQVRKGERSIRIFAPSTRTVVDEADDGSEHKRRVVIGWRLVPVFDIAQTDGDDLPGQPTLVGPSGQPDSHVQPAIAEQITSRGFTLVDGTLSAGVLGETNYHPDHRSVTIDYPDADEAGRIRVLLHELAHVMLHDPHDDTAIRDCQGTREVEADSVAYIVGTAIGLDMGTLSFGYLATWAGQAVGQTITETGQRVITCAHSIIDAVQASATATEKAA